MTLGKKQRKFTRMLAEFIIYIYESGYEISFGDAYRDKRVFFPYSHPNSLHKKRLAADLNLFKDDKYLTTYKDWEPLIEKWIEMGGSNGGVNDSNHFSLKHGNMI